MSNRKKIKTANFTQEKDDSFHIEGGNRGYMTTADTLVTYDIQGVQDREDILFSESKSVYSRYASDRQTLRLDNFQVPFWGEGTNLYPQEVYSVVSENKLLPGILDKLIKYLFGKGLMIYTMETVGEGADQKEVRVPYQNLKVKKQIMDWLNSWPEKGYPHYWEYLKNVITDYYYVSSRSTQFHYSRSRRLNNRSNLPIEALTYVGAEEIRLATDKDITNRILRNEDCKHVILGDWLNLSGTKYEVFNRFSDADPFKYNTAISFDFDKTFTKKLYAYNTWFKPLKEYLKAQYLTPKYLNSYLKNALNAHVHVSIPGLWYEQFKAILQEICSDNIAPGEGVAVVKEFKGVKLFDDNGVPFAYSELMMDQLIACELRRITKMMSGEGKNQGKMYATINWDGHPWEFTKMPGDFKEYFETVIKYSDHADKVLLANMGVSSSLISVDANGKLANQGAEAWYNYLLYVTTIAMDEWFVLRDMIRGIHLNFPEAKADGAMAGFAIDIPSKLRDTTESERPQNTATNNL